MSVVAFVVLAVMLVAYVLTDGYDLGVAVVAPLVARSDGERALVMRSIGPFWNGNEVWLIAAGGALFALFPQAYASSFSGFYLPFVVVLWLLMFRGMAMELRGHFASDLWHNFWDVAFCSASTLLTVLLGVALGNLIRGFPLNAAGFFAGSFALLLNPYALGVGIFAMLALALHGAAFLVMRTDGAPAMRARRLVGFLWWIVLAASTGLTAATLGVRPMSTEHLLRIAALPIVSLAALFAVRFMNARGSAVGAFSASSIFLASLLGAAAATIFPYILPALPGWHGLTIYDASPSPVALYSALWVTIVGVVVVIGYTVVVHGRLTGRAGPHSKP